MELVEARESPTRVFPKALDQPCFSWEVPSLLSDTPGLCTQCLGPGLAAVLLRQTGRRSQSLCSRNLRLHCLCAGGMEDLMFPEGWGS